ncbi:erythromycin esterase family protein [Paenibacillus turpanensis]|uniref:erythromycin esterase family protein n=1 Tax=Paenibacillus turpanensis TaxID=2689078 RepID=UPI0014081F0A|nr:erythromycin esterase family protein [Paenibacillus turpanensis]
MSDSLQAFTDMNQLDALINEAAQSKIVMLGEASHGTSEFYTIRAEITKQLIEKHGFSFIAVEGDWPSCYEMNRYVKQKPQTSAEDALVAAFGRWPEWMWANRETAELIRWLSNYNQEQLKKGQERTCGFYGMDVYSLWESLDEIMSYLERTGASPEEIQAAKRAYHCFEPYHKESQMYGVSAAFLSATCEDEVVELLTSMRQKYSKADLQNEEQLSQELNALVAVNAERYYRSMVRSDAESWNIRDMHMTEVLFRLLDFHGPDAKAVIWEHNTHIGDARATDMAGEGMVNVGQLVREREASSFAIGFSTYKGSVIAGTEWGAEPEVMKVPEAQLQSWEQYFHKEGNGENVWIRFDNKTGKFYEKKGHRAVGVVYHPKYEWGNYVPTVMAERYDALIHVEETTALRPLVREALGER